MLGNSSGVLQYRGVTIAINIATADGGVLGDADLFAPTVSKRGYRLEALDFGRTVGRWRAEAPPALRQRWNL